MIDQVWFFVLAVPVVLLVGMSKGGFAGGLGTLAVPILTLLIDPRQAAAIMLPILCVMDAFALWRYRGGWDKQTLIILLPGAVIGIVLGTLTFGIMNADMIKLIVGIVSIVFVAHYLWTKYSSQIIAPKPQNKVMGSFWGMTAGFTSFIAHAGGPPVSMYLFPLKMDKTKLVATSVFFFIVVNYVKLIPYGYLGQLSFDNLKTSLILLPLAPIGIWLGAWLHTKVSEKIFYVLCYGLLFAVGIKLTVEGLYALLF